MTIKEVMKLVDEYKLEAKKTQRIPHYYKRYGQMLRRHNDDIVYTDRYWELDEAIRKEKVFRCCSCGKKVSYFDLERWTCEFDHGHYLCSLCYEEEMGDDL